MNILMITLTYGIFWANLTTVEPEMGKVNHLFSFRDNAARDILLSWTGDTALGKEGSHVWIAVFGMQCKKVATVDEYLGRDVSSITYLCTAERVEPA